MEIKSNWKYPKPRTGFKGFIDRLSGPGATTLEYIIQFSFAFLGAIIMLVFALLGKLNWNGWQIFVATYLMFDICGGIATNATSSAQRWWHRKERRHLKNDMVFILAHFYMPLLITLVFPLGFLFFTIIYGYLIIAGLIITSVPLYIRRVTALLLYIGALLINTYLFTMPTGIEWFIPFFYLKLLVSHLVIHEPYRPLNKKKG